MPIYCVAAVPEKQKLATYDSAAVGDTILPQPTVQYLLVDCNVYWQQEKSYCVAAAAPHNSLTTNRSTSLLPWVECLLAPINAYCCLSTPTALVGRLMAPFKACWRLSTPTGAVQRLLAPFHRLMAPFNTYWRLPTPAGAFQRLLVPSNAYWRLSTPAGAVQRLLPRLRERRLHRIYVPRQHQHQEGLFFFARIDADWGRLQRWHGREGASSASIQGEVCSPHDGEKREELGSLHGRHLPELYVLPAGLYVSIRVTQEKCDCG